MLFSPSGRAALKGELNARGLEKLTILKEDSRFITQAITGDNAQVCNNGDNTHCNIQCGLSQGLWGVIVWGGVLSPPPRLQKKSSYHYPVKNSVSKATLTETVDREGET